MCIFTWSLIVICEYFSNVRLYDEVEPGTIQKIKITKRDGLILRGKPMKDEGSLH